MWFAADTNAIPVMTNRVHRILRVARRFPNRCSLIKCTKRSVPI